MLDAEISGYLTRDTNADLMATLKKLNSRQTIETACETLCQTQQAADLDQRTR